MSANPEETSGALSQSELDRFTDLLIEAFKTVFDPEIPVDIYELGLIYKVDVSDDRDVAVDMTLTAPGCPVAGEMPVGSRTRSGMFPGCGRSRSTWSLIRPGILPGCRMRPSFN